ncbi:MAG: bifunctional DNA-formamidopyrimidine glycosylase/DNA-(apurinic or apyrimidinic site) lyase [Thermoanaerobaculia bacterium]
MPELPEIEVLRRSLVPGLAGQRIVAVEVANRALREPVDGRRLRRLLPGRRIEGLRRRAKYLLIDLDGGLTLVVHLGMSGRLTLAPRGAPREPHEHVTFQLASGRRLRFRDPRRFGLILLAPTDRLASDPHFARLGIEPLEDGFDGSRLAAAARGRRGPIKSFLMDSRMVVGVGNIYANEALFAAGIHPGRSVARLSATRWQRLAEAVVATLARAIAEGGTTLNDFADGVGNPGEFQVALAVYEREGEACRRCGGRVRRAVHAGRSTYYCPACQR